MIKKPKKLTYIILTAAVHITIFVVGGYVLLHEKKDEAVLRTDAIEITETDFIDDFTIETEPRPRSVDIQGRVRAGQRLEIFPEVQGKITPAEKAFREGIEFRKGETILQLDDEEARFQLYASRSGFQTLVASLLPDIKLDYPDRLTQFEQWFEALHPEKSLPEIPGFDHPQMERYLTSRGVYDRYYQIKSAENQLDKFTIKAPFPGILSSANAEPGQSVGPQAHLGTLVDPESYLLTATVRQSQLRTVRTGDAVELTGQHRSETWTATVTRINPSVDARSQTVEIYLEVRGNGIREGMYLEGILETGKPDMIAEIPKSAMLRNGYVYAVRDQVVLQVPVQVVDFGHHTVWVSGLDEGERIISDAGKALTGRIIRE